MIVTLLKLDGMHRISLPEKIKGQYWVNNKDGQHEGMHLVSIEGIHDQWILKSNKRVQIYDGSGQEVREVPLVPYELYCIYLKENKSYAYLFVEPVTEDRKQYSKYYIKTNHDLTIGRSSSNDIAIDNIAVSSKHACLRRKGDFWEIQDENSTNGIYVNDVRVDKNGSCTLKPGDFIFIMGLKIIIGKGFIALNNPDHSVKLNSNYFLPYTKEQLLARDEDTYESPEVEFFYRSPRFKRDVETKVIKVDAPPSSQQKEEMPLMLTIGPSLTMGMACLTTGLFAVNNAIQNGNIASAAPSIVMSVSMLLGTVMWPILTKKYEKNRTRERESKRQNKYKLYLDEIRNEVKKETEKQREILEENSLTISQCVDTITNVKSSLWDREIGQNDFLKLRIGTGNLPADIKYTYQERRFMLENDNLQNEMLNLCEHPSQMERVPITVSLFQNYFSGVVGNRGDVLAFAKGLILQMVTYYSYDEFKLILLVDAKEKKEFEMLRWIPHIWDDEKQIRFMATNASELKEVSAYMEQVMKKRMNLHEEEQKNCIPYYMIFAFDRSLSNKADMLKLLYQQKTNINVGVISFFDEIKNLPKECATVVELKGNTGNIFNKKDITGERTSFVPDIYVRNNIDLWCMQLSNLKMDIQQASFKLPKMMTFLEMYQVGKIEHLNVLNRWKENDPTVSLEVPVGVDTFGELFKLDLHEKYHGPHGLVAGMTGSGKSEFIMTYILSLALNYHPYEVAFILIDYKGGGMAKAFERLPHTAGIITNLDGAAVKRSLVSIQSELKRRQALFVEAGRKVSESNIDIYKYQKLYRDGIMEEPLPHLFIISDEFAELKTQQQEFMEQLISAARIGRSLGVHLILATQKPAGVVDDQIWSNSKFKICLKVQDRADSMDMLKRPDAAELVDTGRFYLQVGYNELFELGQSAWAGAPYYPADNVQVERDDSVEILKTTGVVLKSIKPRRRSVLRNPQKQLDAITEYLNLTAKNEGIAIRPMWLEPIAEYIYMDALEKKYIYEAIPWSINPVIGEYDDPSRQRQEILTLPVSEHGNTIVYGAAGMGKTTFLNAILYSMIRHHSCEELTLYILDFASGSLRAFLKAPQVGDVLGTGENEKLQNLMKLLHGEIQNRMERFSLYGGDIQTFMKESGESIPNIVVIINNYAMFHSQYEELEEDIIYLSREGTKYGIYFILTAVNVNDIRYRVQQNFNQQFVLQLNDPSDYVSVLGNTYGLSPSGYKGRGLFKGEEIYEFQTAYITEKGTNTSSFIKQQCEELVALYGNGTGHGIPVLPDTLSAKTIGDGLVTLDKVPVGIAKADLQLQYMDLEQQTISLVTGMEMKQIQGFMIELVKLITRISDVEVTVLDPARHLKEAEHLGCTYYNTNMEQQIEQIFDLLVKRNNLYKQTGGNVPKEQAFYHVVYVMQDYHTIYETLSVDIKEKLRVLLEKNEVEYMVHFIISEEAGNMNIRTVEPWFKKHCEKGNGIFVGSGITNQYVLRINDIRSEYRKEIPEDFGYMVAKGVPVFTKLVMKQEVEADA